MGNIMIYLFNSNKYTSAFVIRICSTIRTRLQLWLAYVAQ
jgi:hypothetical protein